MFLTGPELALTLRQWMVLLTVLCIKQALGLDCYNCKHMVVQAESSQLQSLFRGQENANCEKPDSDTVTHRCPQDTQQCGEVKSKTHGRLPFLGSIQIDVLARSCMESKDGMLEGCTKDPDTVKAATLQALGSQRSMTDRLTEGKVCFCGHSHCKTVHCEAGDVQLGPTCIKWYIILIAAFIVVAVMIVLAVCLCRYHRRWKVLQTDM